MVTVASILALMGASYALEPSTSNKSKNTAILYLADLSDDIRGIDFRESLRLLDRTCTFVAAHPVVIMHTGLGIVAEQIRNESYVRIRPSFVDVSPHFGGTRRELRHRRGNYKAMCQFWFTRIFDVAFVARLDYYLRLDTDSKLTCFPSTGDPFAVVSGRIYGYVAVHVDPPSVVRNLTAFAVRAEAGLSLPRARASDRRIHSWHHNDMDAIPELCPFPLFYNNFEVVYVPWFCRPNVRALASAVDATGMIYSSRWGDAPLRFLTLSLFATIDDLVCLGGDFHYVHHGHQHKCLNKTALVGTLGIRSTRVGCVP